MMPFPARGCTRRRVFFDKVAEQSWEPRQGFVRAEALSSNAGAFTHQEHLAGDRFGIAQAGIVAQPDEPLADRRLVLSDNLTRGMVLIR